METFPNFRGYNIATLHDTAYHSLLQTTHFDNEQRRGDWVYGFEDVIMTLIKSALARTIPGREKNVACVHY